MTIKVLEAVGSTLVNFEDEELELLDKAKEAYGFKDINSMLGFVLNAVVRADGNILKYDNEEGTGRFCPKINTLEELTPESEEIYIDLISKVSKENIFENKPIKELEHLPKSQRASVKYRLFNFVSKNLPKG